MFKESKKDHKKPCKSTPAGQSIKTQTQNLTLRQSQKYFYS